MKQEDLIALSDLFHAGISPRIVWQTIGPPDLSETAEPFPFNPWNHWYDPRRVQQATGRKDYQAYRFIELLRDLTHGEGKLQGILEEAREKTIRTSFPPLDWEQLAEVAMMRKWQDKGHWYIQPRKTPEGQRALWAYLYLKHECTNYDELVQEIRGAPFQRFTYPLILHATNRAILDSYPECLPEVKAARFSPDFRCRECGSAAQGTWNGHYWELPPGWVWQTSLNEHSIYAFCSRRCTLPIIRKHRWELNQNRTLPAG